MYCIVEGRRKKQSRETVKGVCAWASRENTVEYWDAMVDFMEMIKKDLNTRRENSIHGLQYLKPSCSPAELQCLYHQAHSRYVQTTQAYVQQSHGTYEQPTDVSYTQAQTTVT